MSQLQRAIVPASTLWDELLSGDKSRMAVAVETINRDGQAEDFVSLLFAARRDQAQRERRLLGLIPLRRLITERERRAALSAIALIWGTLGREVACVLDPRATYHDREHARQSLIRRRDARAIRPIVEAMIAGSAPELLQCILLLAALGDQRAAEGLLRYVGLSRPDSPSRPWEVIHEFGIEVGKALRTLNVKSALETVTAALNGENAYRQGAAAVVLAGWRGVESADPVLTGRLLALLSNTGATDDSLRLALALALGELRVTEARLPLERLLSSPNLALSHAARSALEQINIANAQRAVKAGKRSNIRPAD